MVTDKWKRNSLVASERPQHLVLHAGPEQSKLRQPGKRKVWKEKPPPVSLHELKQTKLLSAFALHLTALLRHELMKEILSFLVPTLGFWYLGKIKPLCYSLWFRFWFRSLLCWYSTLEKPAQVIWRRPSLCITASKPIRAFCRGVQYCNCKFSHTKSRKSTQSS